MPRCTLSYRRSSSVYIRTANYGEEYSARLPWLHSPKRIHYRPRFLYFGLEYKGSRSTCEPQLCELFHATKPDLLTREPACDHIYPPNNYPMSEHTHACETSPNAPTQVSSPSATASPCDDTQCHADNPHMICELELEQNAALSDHAPVSQGECQGSTDSPSSHCCSTSHFEQGVLSRA
jgi:hypothetical protein